jgi:hypothetical protein
MKVLVSILTSGKPELLKLCYDSIIGQETPDFEYDIVVIVNTLNNEYADVVRRVLPAGVNIQETESNGRPGKGHNSVLRHFAAAAAYDYCVMVDGDDFLYPRALVRLQHYLCYRPDVLFITFHDKIQTTLAEGESNIPYLSIQNKGYLLYNLTEVTLQEWYKIKGAKNPFTTNINELNTLARPFVFSKASLELDIYYDENMKLFDDFIVFMKCFEHSLLGNLKVYGMVDADMYLYNTITSDTATKTYFGAGGEVDRINENARFLDSIKNKFLTLKRWDITRFPLLELGQTNEPDNLLVKYKFVDGLFTQLMLPITDLSNADNIALVISHCSVNNMTGFLEDLQGVSKFRDSDNCFRNNSS